MFLCVQIQTKIYIEIYISPIHCNVNLINVMIYDPGAEFKESIIYLCTI